MSNSWEPSVRFDDDATLIVDCKTSVDAGVVVEASCVGDTGIFGRGTTENASMPRINHGTMAKVVVVTCVFIAGEYVVMSGSWKCREKDLAALRCTW